MPPRAPRRTEGSLPPVFCTGWLCLGSAGMHCGSTTLWGYIAVNSATGMHRGCLCTRRDTSRLPPHAHILHYMQSPFLQTKRGCLTGSSPDVGMHRGCLRCFRDRISYKIPFVGANAQYRHSITKSPVATAYCRSQGRDPVHASAAAANTVG